MAPVAVPVITAASFVPVIVTVSVWLVPSAVVTVKASVYVAPASNSSWALFMGVAPGPGRIDGKLAVAVGAGHIGPGHEAIRRVHVRRDKAP